MRGVSFPVEHGELFALLGTDGAGKTSTVELLKGLAAPPAARCGCWAVTRTASGRRSGRGSG